MAGAVSNHPRGLKPVKFLAADARLKGALHPKCAGCEASLAAAR